MLGESESSVLCREIVEELMNDVITDKAVPKGASPEEETVEQSDVEFRYALRKKRTDELIVSEEEGEEEEDVSDSGSEYVDEGAEVSDEEPSVIPRTKNEVTVSPLFLI